MKYTNKTNSSSNSISHTNDQLTYAFIDAQNLHQSSKHWGWKLDYSKFREYLRIEFNVSIAYLFMGYIQENQEIYSNLQKQGYILVFRETSEVDEHIKGNCDVELVMQAMLDYNEYEQAVVVTGDGDFTPLIRHLNNKGKLKNLLIPNRESFSKWLTKTAKGKMTFINLLKSRLYAPMHSGDVEAPIQTNPNHNQNPIRNHNRTQISHPEVTDSTAFDTGLDKITNEPESKPERPKMYSRNNRGRNNQPAVIKFYNPETSQQVNTNHETEVVSLPINLPIIESLPISNPVTEISSEIPKDLETPKKTPRPRGRTPKAKTVSKIKEITEDVVDQIPTQEPDLSKPTKAVSIHL